MRRIHAKAGDIIGARGAGTYRKERVMFHEDSLQFAKIVHDLDGDSHILVDGILLRLQGERGRANAAAEIIVAALRRDRHAVVARDGNVIVANFGNASSREGYGG